ncbi:MAG: GNAT family N-acetyltransferase [Thermoanaerobaculia bacterium]
MSAADGTLDFQALTPDRWRDFKRLFGENGACGGCWCMWFRVTNKAFEASKGEANRRAMKALVEGGEPPGILAYVDREPVGWCALAPRPSYGRLARSRILKPVDERPVWSVVCFFVDRRYRGRGITVGLLEAAADHARRRGGSLLEGYPVEPRKERAPSVFMFHGLASAFAQAGFAEVARRSETRPIMRREIEPAAGG